jgi:ribonuclease BN (tRNA processing enzyme)
VLALVMTFLVGTIFAGEDAGAMGSGFPVRLFILLAGVTYLFAIAANNGTIERIIEGAAHLFRDHRAMIPWVVFIVASLPAMAGALGSAGVAILAPISLRLAQRYSIDRRMIGLLVVHGAAAGNFSPLNPLGVLVNDAVRANGLEWSASVLFFGNLAYNIGLGVVIYVVFGGLGLIGRPAIGAEREGVLAEGMIHEAIGEGRHRHGKGSTGLRVDQVCTLVALLAVAVAALGFRLDIGFLAFGVAAMLQLIFPKSSGQADKKIAWSVILLVCGVVTYVSALQRLGTVDAIGNGIAGLNNPLLGAFLICVVGAVTSAVASSAGILGAMIPLAAPFMARGEVGATGLVVTLALSATVVDATPFSTVGALIVMDHGPGAHHRLIESGHRATRVGAAFFTHLHYDHCMDYARLVLQRWDQGADRIPDLKVYGPAPIAKMTESLFSEEGVYGPDIRSRIEHQSSIDAFEARGGMPPRRRPAPQVREVHAGDAVEGDGWRVTVGHASHVQPHLECLAFRLDSDDGSFCYSGDSGPCEELIDLARGCDALLHMNQHFSGTEPSPSYRAACGNHRDNAVAARRAGVKTLVLTHFLSQIDRPGVRERIVHEIQKEFDGRVIWGEDLMQITIGENGIPGIEGRAGA